MVSIQNRPFYNKPHIYQTTFITDLFITDDVDYRPVYNRPCSLYVMNVVCYDPLWTLSVMNFVCYKLQLCYERGVLRTGLLLT